MTANLSFARPVRVGEWVEEHVEIIRAGRRTTIAATQLIVGESVIATARTTCAAHVIGLAGAGRRPDATGPLADGSMTEGPAGLDRAWKTGDARVHEHDPRTVAPRQQMAGG